MSPGRRRRSRPSTTPTCAISSCICTGCSIRTRISTPSADAAVAAPMSLVKRVVGSRPFQRTAGFVAAEYLRLVWKTTRFTIEPSGIYERFERDAPVIIAMWHGQQFLIPFIKRDEDRAKVLISRHRDGEVNALAAERLGVGAIRGSGHLSGGFIGKGGVSAFKEMLSALEEGCNVALTADIPKVARVAGLGIVKLASASGRPIHPLAIE